MKTTKLVGIDGKPLSPLEQGIRKAVLAKAYVVIFLIAISSVIYYLANH